VAPRSRDVAVNTQTATSILAIHHDGMTETTPGQNDDVALVHAARDGDRFAFGQIYQRYGRMVHGILLSRVPPSAVDDLVQDVFLKAMVQLRHLRDLSSFGGWIGAIARNRANDFFRHNREAAELPEDISVPENASAEAEARTVLNALKELPETYRETLTLRLVEGMTGPEIAQLTGLTPSSVRVNLHRGMKLLRQQLERRR
jgi:RNA polymerase sigma-70 factor, ECF subfamily